MAKAMQQPSNGISKNQATTVQILINSKHTAQQLCKNMQQARKVIHQARNNQAVVMQKLCKRRGTINNNEESMTNEEERRTKKGEIRKTKEERATKSKHDTHKSLRTESLTEQEPNRSGRLQVLTTK